MTNFIGYLLKKTWRILLLIVGIIIIYTVLNNANLFPIQAVEIHAPYQHVSQQTLRKTIAPYMVSSFFTVDLERVKDSLLSIPWVYQASITRSWPATIIVKVTEQFPVVCWNKTAFINVDNRVIKPNDFICPTGLVQFFAPDEMGAEVWQTYRNMQNSLDAVHLTILSLRVDADENWQLKFNNNLILRLSNTNKINELTAFIKAYPDLGKGGNRSMVSIDMRYANNGFAVKWQRNE
jgi:cell division protein FtsQ